MSRNWADMGDDDVVPKGGNDYSRSVDKKTGVITESYIRTTVKSTEQGDITESHRITRKFTETKKATRVNRHVQARRQWTKFGDCKGMAPGIELNITSQDAEERNLEFFKVHTEEKKAVKVMSQCRKCGGTDHWTLQCPNFAGGPPEDDAPKAPAPESRVNPISLASGGTGKYVPKHLRDGGAGARPMGDMFMGGPGGDRKRDYGDERNSLRVTNLSQETKKEDLIELVNKFGPTSRVYLAEDRVTGLSRGFAFVTYIHREDAQRAIDKLNGYGYDQLILHVEWAKPREERPEDAAGGADGSARARAVQEAQRRRF